MGSGVGVGVGGTGVGVGGTGVAEAVGVGGMGVDVGGTAVGVGVGGNGVNVAGGAVVWVGKTATSGSTACPSPPQAASNKLNTIRRTINCFMSYTPFAPPRM